MYQLQSQLIFIKFLIDECIKHTHHNHGLGQTILIFVLLSWILIK